MNSITIIHGPSGCGKTRWAERFAHHFNRDRIVDDWDGHSPLSPGDLALTNATIIQGMSGAEIFTSDEAMRAVMLSDEEVTEETHHGFDTHGYFSPHGRIEPDVQRLLRTLQRRINDLEHEVNWKLPILDKQVDKLRRRLDYEHIAFVAIVISTIAFAFLKDILS